jgi:hypothetical protein
MPRSSDPFAAHHNLFITHSPRFYYSLSEILPDEFLAPGKTARGPGTYNAAQKAEMAQVYARVGNNQAFS